MKNRRFFLIYFCFWFAENCISPYLGVFYETKGFSGTQIGVLNSIFSAAVVAAALGVGLIGDRLRDLRHLLMALCLGMSFGVAGVYFGGSFGAVSAAVCLYGVAYSPFNGTADRMLMGRLRGQPERFGRYRMGGTFGAMAGVLAAGILIRFLPFGALFAVYWMAMAACALWSGLLPHCDFGPQEKAAWRDYAAILRSHRSLAIYAVMAVWGFTESGSMQFLALHVVRCGGSHSLVSILVAAAMVGESALFLAVPQLMAHMGKRWCVALAFLLQLGRLAALTFLGVLPLSLVILLQVSGGGAYACLYSAVTLLISETFPERIACTAQNLKLVVTRGIGTTCGSMMLGILYDRGNTAAAYGVLAAAAGVAAIVVNQYREKRSRA